MQVQGLTINGRASQTLAAAAGNDLVRLQDVQSLLSGVPTLSHKHVAADITDLPSAVLALLAASGLTLSGVLTLTPGGGLLNDLTGLHINSGIVSLVGHKHVAADITNMAPAVSGLMIANIASTPSLAWFNDGTHLSGVVQVKANGGLISDVNGLSVNLGTGHNQAAFGDHTHAQLHNPVTISNGSTVAIALAGQALTAEVVTPANSGLLLSPSGVVADFGTGHNQVMRGDALTGLALTGIAAVSNTATLLLGITGTVLSGVVPLDPAPPGGVGGLIVAGVNGLRVALGTTSTTAAAGNHTHLLATALADGMMSAADKAKLDSFDLLEVSDTATVNLTLTVQVLSGVQTPVLSADVDLDPTPAAGYAPIVAGPSGLRVVLGTTASTAAAGNHLHTGVYLPLTGGVMLGALTLSGVLTITGATTTAPANLSGVVGWFAANINGNGYRIPLYQ